MSLTIRLGALMAALMTIGIAVFYIKVVACVQRATTKRGHWIPQF